jgi:hypothetical protein
MAGLLQRRRQWSKLHALAVILGDMQRPTSSLEASTSGADSTPTKWEAAPAEQSLHLSEALPPPSCHVRWRLRTLAAAAVRASGGWLTLLLPGRGENHNFLLNTDARCGCVLARRSFDENRSQSVGRGAVARRENARTTTTRHNVCVPPHPSQEAPLRGRQGCWEAVLWCGTDRCQHRILAASRAPRSRGPTAPQEKASSDLAPDTG